MTKLCPRGKAAAKRKFAVYPSAYANAYASKICAGKIKDPSGTKRKDFKGPKPAGKVVGGMAVRIGKAGVKYLKSKEGKEKVKKVMESPLPKKTGELLKKFKNAMTKKKGGGMTAGSQSAMGRLQKARMMNKGGDANTMIKKSGIKDPKFIATAHSLKTKDRLTESDIKKAKDMLSNPKRKALPIGDSTRKILGDTGYKKVLKERDKAVSRYQVNEGRSKAKKVKSKLRNFKNQTKGFLKEMTGFNKGGGADTGRRGELKSKLSVAINKIKRNRPTRPDIKKIKQKFQSEKDLPRAMKIDTTTSAYGDAGKGRPVPKYKSGGLSDYYKDLM